MAWTLVRANVNTGIDDVAYDPVEPGPVIAAHVALLSAGGTDTLKEAAAIALGNFANTCKYAAAIMQAGAVVPLVMRLSAGGTAGKARRASHLSLPC